MAGVELLLQGHGVTGHAETEDKELDLPTVTRGVTRAFEQSDEAVYFVAEANDTDTNSAPIGSLMITREWSDWRDGWLVWIQSVYVLQAYRGVGVYRALYDDVRIAAQARADVCGLRLYVEKDNHHAQQVYTKTGMTETAYKLFEVDFTTSA